MTNRPQMHSEQLHRFCVAPMMDWTDRHCRYFHRLLTRRALLYTEMVTSAAILHGNRERLLGFHPAEHPVALQLGGSNSQELAQAAEIGARYGYDEINLNCGCPSDRVQSGRFGACLMAEPELVGECVEAMRSATGGELPVTVKCRIGIDDQDSEMALTRFVETIASSGCDTFIVHARKAWLQGLSPKQNRDIPPLDYDRVYRIKALFPELTIVINGGLVSIAGAAQHLHQVDGVMLGRAAYKTPRILTEVDGVIFEDDRASFDAGAVMNGMISYARNELEAGTRLSAITRHMLGLFNGQPRARRFRQILTEESIRPGAGVEVLQKARELMLASRTAFPAQKAA